MSNRYIKLIIRLTVLSICFGNAYGQNPLGGLAERFKSAARDVGSQLSGSAKSNIAAQMTVDGNADSIEISISNLVKEVRSSKDFMTDSLVPAERSAINRSADIESDKLSDEVRVALSEISKGNESSAKTKLLALAENKQDFTAAAMLAIILNARETKGVTGSTAGKLRTLPVLAEQKNPIAMYYYGRWLVASRADRLGAEYINLAAKAGHWGAALTETMHLSNGTSPYALDVKAAIENAEATKSRVKDEEVKNIIEKYIASIKRNEAERERLKDAKELAHRQRVEAIISQNRKNNVIFFCEDKYRNGAAHSLAKTALSLAANSDLFAERIVRPPMSDYCNMVTGGRVLTSAALDPNTVDIIAERDDKIYFTVTSGRNVFGVISVR